MRSSFYRHDGLGGGCALYVSNMARSFPKLNDETGKHLRNLQTIQKSSESCCAAVLGVGDNL